MPQAYGLTDRDKYNAYINLLQNNPGNSSYNQAASYIGNTWGKSISPQEYLAALGQIYPPTGGGGDTGGGDTGYYGSDGSYYGGGGGAPAYDPNLDINKITPLRSEAAQKIAAANDVYNAIYNDLKTYTTDVTNRLKANYATQFDILNKAYERAQSQLPRQYAARGTASSSEFDRALRDAGDTYNSQNNALTQDEQAKLADVSKQYQTNLAGFQASQNSLNSIRPQEIGTVSDLNAALNTINSSVGNLNTQRAGLNTQGGFLSQLNAITPIQQTGSATLEAQLQKLAQSSAPLFAKQQLAAGLIKQAGDPQGEAFWSDYYQKQQNQAQAAAAGV